MGSKGVRYGFVLLLFLLFQLRTGLAPKPVFAKNLDNITIEIENVATGLNLPISLKNAGDGSGNLFIVEQGGRVLIYDGTQLLPNAFLDISSLVSSGSERGLLDITFHPDYATNGFFYVHYTDLLGSTVIARYSRSANPQLADPSSGTIILTVSQPFPNHNGGQLEFGPDGFLYIALGDGGVPGTDPSNPAQNLNQLLGKILRIDINGGPPYAIPADNPFAGVAGTRPEIWAYGLRNPWRFSFDRETGDLLIADVGQSSLEEVNFQAAASPGGENYGWPFMEGSSCFSPSTNCNDGSLALPILEYSHSLGNCSISGGYRYRGSMFPQLTGIYFYGDFCSGRIWGADTDINGNWASKVLLDTTIGITTFGEDESGEVYLVAYGAGNLLRINQINIRAVFNDFNADITSDLLGYNTADGTIGAGFIANAALTSSNFILQADPASGWTLNATGDFNGDNNSDLLLYNTLSGDIRMVWLDGTTVLLDVVVLTLSPASGLAPLGTGDFDNDGIAEIVLFNASTGDLELVFLNGALFGSQIPVITIPVIDGWAPVGTGDFNGDGQSDFLGFNSTAGRLAYIEMNGAAPVNFVDIFNFDPSLGWQALDSADYNADGKTDTLFFNTNSRVVGTVLQDSGAVLSFVEFGVLPLSLEYVNSGDYNADGLADILVLDTVTGDVSIALQDGTQITSSHNVINLDLAAGWTLHSGKP